MAPKRKRSPSEEEGSPSTPTPTTTTTTTKGKKRQRRFADIADVEMAIRKARPNLSENSIRQYMNRLTTLAEKTGAGDNLVVWLKSATRAIARHISSKYTNSNSIKTAYTPLVVASKALGLDRALAFYEAEMVRHIEIVKAQHLESKLPDKFLKAGLTNLPEWSLFQQRAREMIAQGETKGNIHHALAALHVLLPPRRLETRLLFFYAKNPFKVDPAFPRPQSVLGDEPLDDKGVAYNYVYKTRGGGLRMVMRAYKTARIHGVYVTDLPKEVSDVLFEYGVTDGEPLFLKPKAKTLFDASSWSSQLKAMLKKLTEGTGLPQLTATDLRKIIVTDAHSSNMTAQAKADLAADMGHTVLTAGNVYLKNSTGGGKKMDLLAEKEMLERRLAQVIKELQELS